MIKTIDIENQKNHLINHLIKNKQYKLAKDMGARLSQFNDSVDIKRLMRSSVLQKTIHSS
jgi:ribosomal protein L22